MDNMENGEAKALGDYLKRLRGAAGLTQGQAAERAGVSVAYISLLERGSKSEPSYNVLNKLAQAYNADLRQVLIHAGREVTPEEEMAWHDALDPVMAVSKSMGRPMSIKEAEEVDTGRPVLEPRLNWAIQTIYNDPEYRTGTRRDPQLLDEPTKMLIVELYQEATGRRLLTKNDNVMAEAANQSDAEEASL